MQINTLTHYNGMEYCICISNGMECWPGTWGVHLRGLNGAAGNRSPEIYFC